MAEKTFHQVMLIFKMPRDPSLEISCIEVVLDDLVYVISSSEGFLTTNTDYVAWFSESSVGPIVDDCLVSGCRVLGGIACARRALEAHLRLHVETLQAWVRGLESVAVTREGYT